MNRRNALKAAIVAGMAPTVALPQSREDEKREILIRIAGLELSEQEQFEFAMLSMAVSPGPYVGNQPDATVDDLRQALSVTDTYKRVQDRTEAILYGPGRRPYRIA